MNLKRFREDSMNAAQSMYDNMEAPFDEGYQTQEEIENENEQELIYINLIDDALDMDWYATSTFSYFINEINGGYQEEAGELLMNMIANAADYNGSEATVPDFVRLVRMAFEWKSKQ